VQRRVIALQLAGSLSTVVT